MKEKDIKDLLDYGVFSELDIHFARLMTSLSGQQIPELFFASVLVSQATREGHVCLDLSTQEGKHLTTGEPGTGTFVCPNLHEWHSRLESSSVIGKPGEYRPLILDEQSRLYLYRYWLYEKTLGDDIKARAGNEIGEIDVPLLKDSLSRLFTQTRDGETDWQKLAALLSVMKRFCVISGGPGTGKSTLIAKILALILEQKRENETHIALAAPTGKAAARLQEAIGAEASTIHRLLGPIPHSPYFRHNAENPLPVRVVVIDEASMVDLALMSKLVQAVPSDARLILLGDKDQLASVEAGAVLGDICGSGRIHGFSQGLSDRFQEITGDRTNITPELGSRPEIQDSVVQLKKSYRFSPHSGIGKVSQAVNKGEGDQALNLLKSAKYDEIIWKRLPSPDALYRTLRDNIIRGYSPYLKATDPMEIFSLFEQFRLLCALRKGPYGVSALNVLAEQILRDENLINPDKLWYRGRPVLITRNDYNLGLFNGDIGIILPAPGAHHNLRAFFLRPDGTLLNFLPTRLPRHETVYAMTVHKSQGSEFDNALLLLPNKHTPVLTRELIYTAITRVRQGVEIWGIESVFLEGISHRIERASGLREALWGT